MSKKPTDDNDPLWGKVKRTVEPLRPGSSKPQNRQSFEAMMHVKPEPQRRAKPSKAPPDINQEKKIRRGKVDIDLTIDLHDQTRAKAETHLKRSLIRAYNRNHKTVLVITGKGARLDGVLRNAFPGWMSDTNLRPIIASYAPAHIRHGGSGAWYVFLKA